jgi:hypothetical protein
MLLTIPRTGFAATTPRQYLDTAIAEHMLGAYYRTKFLPQNKLLGSAVDAYLKGGARPSEALLGSNHYARGLVGTEDARRLL